MTFTQTIVVGAWRIMLRASMINLWSGCANPKCKAEAWWFHGNFRWHLGKCLAKQFVRRNLAFHWYLLMSDFSEHNFTFGTFQTSHFMHMKSSTLQPRWISHHNIEKVFCGLQTWLQMRRSHSRIGRPGWTAWSSEETERKENRGLMEEDFCKADFGIRLGGYDLQLQWWR